MGRAFTAAQLLPTQHQTSARHAEPEQRFTRNLVGFNQVQTAVQETEQPFLQAP